MVLKYHLYHLYIYISSTYINNTYTLISLVIGIINYYIIANITIIMVLTIISVDVLLSLSMVVILLKKYTHIYIYTANIIHTHVLQGWATHFKNMNPKRTYFTSSGCLFVETSTHRYWLKRIKHLPFVLATENHDLSCKYQQGCWLFIAMWVSRSVAVLFFFPKPFC